MSESGPGLTVMSAGMRGFRFIVTNLSGYPGPRITEGGVLSDCDEDWDDQAMTWRTVDRGDILIPKINYLDI